jgi:hypothetical protein
MAPTFIKLTKVWPGHERYFTGAYSQVEVPEKMATQGEFHVNMNDVVEMHPHKPDRHNPACTELVRANGNCTFVLEEAADILGKLDNGPGKPVLRRVP